MDDFLAIYGTAQWMGAEEILTALLMALVLSSVLATIYRWTFQSISYSRSFIHTMVISSMIVSFIIMAIGDSFARGLGILGTLAIVRFRTPVRDTRDMTFLFACMGIGVACGAAAIGVAVISTFVIGSALMLLHWSPFASRRQHEALLRFTLPATSASDEKVKDIMRTNCSAFSLIAMREAGQGDLVEYCYEVRLIDPSYQADIIESLGQIPDVLEPNLLLQRTTVEL
jgi:uncharacterized membrane protein YhiD involved in acid resistance